MATESTKVPSLDELLSSFAPAPESASRAGGFRYATELAKLQTLADSLAKLPADSPHRKQSFGIEITTDSIAKDYPNLKKVSPASVASTLRTKLNEVKAPAGFEPFSSSTTSGEKRATDPAWVGFVPRK